MGVPAALSAEAVDLPYADLGPDEARGALHAALAGLAVDYVAQPAEGRRKRMLIADMDSTMIQVECIDELADFAGLKDRVAIVTEAAMRGELDFAEALAQRVALLGGMTVETLERCYTERVVATPGAEALVKTMAGSGALTVLVSGGFTFFTERVAKRLGFSHQRANVLAHEGGRLTGKVVEPIVTAETKRDTLVAMREKHGLRPNDVMAVGDGANDIPMLQAAGLGVAFHAKPKAEAAADIAIRHGDLTALLYVQGYRSGEIFRPQ